MKRLPLILLMLVLCAVSGPAQQRKGKARTAGSVRTERKEATRQIRETQAKLKTNAAATAKRLDELNNISARIDVQMRGIDSLRQRVAAIDANLAATNRSVKVLTDSVSRLKKDLADALRALRTRHRLRNSVAFVFSPESFNQAFRRARYLQDLNAWRARKITALRGTTRRLEQQQKALKTMRMDRANSLSLLDAGRVELEGRKATEQNMIAELRREGTTLNALLVQKQKRVRELDAELDRIIAEQQRRDAEKRKAAEKARKEKAARDKASKKKPAPAKAPAPAHKPQSKPAASQPAITGTADEDRRLTGSFAANRGRLLFPVAGRYSVVSVFGRNHHRSLSNVEINNSGIDIAVPSGTQARAVFQGTVSSVFFMNGFQNIVIIRHGDYLTVYAGLTGLRVRKGQEVKAGTPLGTVFTDKEGGEWRTVLHFEVRQERTKLNPLDWVQ